MAPSKRNTVVHQADPENGKDWRMASDGSESGPRQSSTLNMVLTWTDGCVSRCWSAVAAGGRKVQVEEDEGLVLQVWTGRAD